MTRENVNIFALVAVSLAVVVATMISISLGEDVNFNKNNQSVIIPNLLTRLEILAVVALLIERAVEVYLRAAGYQPEPVHVPSAKTTYKAYDVVPLSVLTAMVLSLPIAVLGLRILDPFLVGSALKCVAHDNGTVSGCGTFAKSLYWFLDIALTVSFLAGGSALIHGIIQLLPTATDRIQVMISGADPAPGNQPTTVYLGSADKLEEIRARIALLQDPTVAADKYKISIERTAGTTGTLYFEHGNTNLVAPCRWDPENRIDAGTLTKCSKTIMATKKRPAIYLPGAYLHGKRNSNIFIHKGKDETWSDGCIVLDESNMKTLLDAIKESDAMNITVSIQDL